GLEEPGRVPRHLLHDMRELQRLRQHVAQLAQREELADAAVELGRHRLPLGVGIQQRHAEPPVLDHQSHESRDERNEEEPPGGKAERAQDEPSGQRNEQPEPRRRIQERKRWDAGPVQLDDSPARPLTRSVTYTSGGAFGLTRTDLAGIPTFTWKGRTFLVASAPAPTMPFRPTRTPASTVA